MNEIEMKIMGIKYNRIITDPFPEHTEYEMEKRYSGFFSRPTKPKSISIWEAYVLGYDKAYKEVIEGLKNERI